MKKVLAAAAVVPLGSKNFPQTMVIASSGSAASKNIKIFQHIGDKGNQNIIYTLTNQQFLLLFSHEIEISRQRSGLTDNHGRDDRIKAFLVPSH